jgi:hypothetical protein
MHRALLILKNFIFVTLFLLGVTSTEKPDPADQKALGSFRFHFVTPLRPRA